MTMNLKNLVGKTMKRVKNTRYNGQDAFILEDGDYAYILAHDQECCENVYIEDICGDLEDLIDAPLVLAEEVSQSGETSVDTSATWTFYKFATVKGYVTIRFFGSSTGAYSEGVSLEIHPYLSMVN